ncbi:helix-turn-helix transcriptional regulator [Thaumasiovibrio subtropicus]|uniref:helix-turn-helix transcriptional regulator n=1 Tax=Thaumasiovibrio subtropicus TaxID=1891207 RepID=UPI000B36028F|nr:helix-turn-helix transcriptional regulator [Thaumasiovibrio subtropicus]
MNPAIHEFDHASLYYAHLGWSKLYTKALPKDLLKQRIEGVTDLRILRDAHYQYIKTTPTIESIFSLTQHIDPLTFDSFSLALYTAGTVSDLVEAICEFGVVLGMSVKPKLHFNLHGDLELIIFPREPDVEDSVTTSLGILLYVLSLTKMIADTQMGQVHLEFRTPALPLIGSDIEEVTARSGCALYTGYPVSKLIIPSRYVAAPLSSANKEIHAIHRALLVEQSARLNSNDICLQVRSYLEQLDSLEGASVVSIADSLLMSVRTLNRRLRLAGTSCKAMIEQFKHQKALYLLVEKHQSVTSVALQLGFTDVSNFNRAFKRWSGESPSSLLGRCR